MNSQLHLKRILAAAYLYLQGAICVLWWLLVMLSPTVRGWFLWDQLPQEVLYAFMPGDLFFYGAISLLLGYGFSRQRKWIVGGSHILAGAVLYAWFMTFSLSALTVSGAPGFVLMSFSFTGTIFCLIVAIGLHEEEALT